MPTASVNGIDVYYERGGEGRPAALPQRVGVDAGHQRDRDRAVPRALRPRRPRPAGPGPHLDPARAVLDGRLRGRRRGAARRGRLGPLPGRGHQLRRDGRPGAGGHLARAHRAPGPALHLAGWCGRGVVPAPRAGRSGRRGPCREGADAARHPVHRRVARHPRLGPDDRRDDGGASFDPAHRRGAPRGARAAAGAPPPRRVGPARPDQLPDPRRRRSLRRHRAAGQRRGHRQPHPRRGASALRGRPRLLRPGSGGAARRAGLPRRRDRAASGRVRAGG